MAEQKPRRNMAGFRNTLNQVMVVHEVYDWKGLREQLRATGYNISQSGLSQYLSGARTPQSPQDFFDAIAAALGLSEEEKMRISYAFAYPECTGGGAMGRRDLAEGIDAEERMRKRLRDGGGESGDSSGEGRV